MSRSSRLSVLTTVAIACVVSAATIACSSATQPNNETESPITETDACEGAQEAYEEAQRSLASCRLGASDSTCAGLLGSDCESCIEKACSENSGTTKTAASTQAKCRDGGNPLEVHVSFECSADAGVSATRDQ